MPNSCVYLDCAATTPLDPRVAERVMHYLSVEYGNAGSRTHEFGLAARRAVEKARDQVAVVVGATRGEVIFTSGATESDNLAILGLAAHGRATKRMHVVTTAIEHHAVLEPIEALREQGFETTLVRPTAGGWVDPQAVLSAVRPDTLLVSVMQVNNETGVVQPISEIARLLSDHPAYFHVDAAQGFGKLIEPLRDRRIDLISVSGHKIFAPKGVGALILRKRDGKRPPLSPLMHGGGQELGLRPGTLPVALVAGLGYAAELALAEAKERTEANRRFRDKLFAGLSPLRPAIHGDVERLAPNIVNLSFPGVDGEAAIEALHGLIAVSNGAACTTQSKTCSHVLTAMGVNDERSAGALRLSWRHLTPDVDWPAVVAALRPLLR